MGQKQRKEAQLQRQVELEEKRVERQRLKEMREVERAEKAAERARKVEAQHQKKYIQQAQQRKRKASQVLSPSNKRQKRASAAHAGVQAGDELSATPAKVTSREHGTLREWITALQDTVGMDADEERARVRERYHAALKPMRTPENWEAWLSEYDQAATRAETLAVAEVTQTQAMIDDFLGSVSKVASTWTAAFHGPGYDKKAINRKRIMKLFRDYMSLHNPTRGKPKSAFSVVETSYAAGGESDPNTQRDASSVETRAPSSNNQGRGNLKPLNKRKNKQFTERDTATAGGICPACEQPHSISDCYYVNGQAPEWFKPNRGTTKLVQYKLDHDPSLQTLVRERSQQSKRPRITSASRSVTPYIKTSQTLDSVTD
ncbi:hypothetical protein PtrV1_06456 [Pyrenophora tritici-repentis]|nr:hypothetical protein PtrV1_06456 [Pyrenophora tritici-repentis]